MKVLENVYYGNNKYYCCLLKKIHERHAQIQDLRHLFCGLISLIPNTKVLVLMQVLKYVVQLQRFEIITNTQSVSL